jgi:hypothetical protein
MRIQLLMGTSAVLFINCMPPEPAITPPADFCERDGAAT